MAKMFALFKAARATLPGGSFSIAVAIGSIDALGGVWSVKGCPSMIAPGAGS